MKNKFIMNRRPSIILNLVWFYFVMFIANKYFKGFNYIISSVITVAILYLGMEIIDHFTPNKKNV